MYGNINEDECVQDLAHLVPNPFCITTYILVLLVVV